MAKLKSRRLKFTDAFVRSAQAETYTDIVQTGLRLRVSPKGLRTFFHLYRLHGVGEIGKRGKRGVGPIRKNVLGHYPGLSLEDARKLVKETREKVRAGDDPREMPTEASDVRTFAEVAKMALTNETRPTTHHDLKNYLLPLLGARHIDAVTRSEIAGVLDKAHSPKAPTREGRVLGTLQKIFEYADERGYLSSTTGIKQGRAESQKRRPHDRARGAQF